jgi:surface carbohydrate biosynthesis protein
MSFNRFKLKLKRFYKILIAPPKEWKLPKNCEVLVYDACGSEVLAPYLTSYSVGIMSVRGESVNIPCLLRATLKMGFWTGKPLDAYADAFIQAVSPKVVITFIDNDPHFYTISKRFLDVKTILLQNGMRDDWLGGFSENNEYCVDYMLVFGDSIAAYYCAHIFGEVVPAGSLRNNQVKKSSDIADGAILFISQYCDKPKSNAPFFVYRDGASISFDQFYSAEVHALRFLRKWCIKNQMHLQICGVFSEKTGPERDFYANILNGCAWEYISRSDQYSSYKLVDSAEIVVFIDSTLGYESIGRGKKTAGFSFRGLALNRIDRKFGWPGDLPDNGPFWTNNQDEEQLQRVMDYLNTVSDLEWEKTRQRYASKLMEFDAGNTRFIALLKQLLPETDNFAYAH